MPRPFHFFVLRDSPVWVSLRFHRRVVHNGTSNARANFSNVSTAGTPMPVLDARNIAAEESRSFFNFTFGIIVSVHAAFASDHRLSWLLRPPSGRIIKHSGSEL